MSEKKFYVVYHDEYDYDLNYVADEKDNKLDAEDCCDLLNQLSEENERLRQQQQRLFNYFNDYLKDEMDSDNFSEMWDNVKKDVRWNNE